MKKFGIVSLMLACMLPATILANVRLPYILSDSMVLQRQAQIKIWGWADNGEKVSVQFNGQTATAKTNDEGTWSITLSPMEAGGPYDLTISGKNQITLKNILLGDVYICGGQSNMEWPLSRSRNWDKDKATVNNDNIRLFYVEKTISSVPLDNTQKATWKSCTAASAENFSAIGYYFGKNLNDNLHVPIGLINSNWGGTDIETWISMESMYADKEFTAVIDNMKKSDMAQLQLDAERKMKKWQDTISNFDPGMLGKWYSADLNTAGWSKMHVPQLWEGAGHPNLDGVVWFRVTFDLSENEIADGAILSLGPIDDSDDSYVNGQLVGKTENQYAKSRVYSLAKGILKPGRNVLAIRVTDTGGGGGIWGRNEDVYIECGGSRKYISGDWLYNIAFDMPVPQTGASPNSFPSLLYNGMIQPLVHFTIKGAIWYQGENNSGRYIKYRELFPRLINDWRTKWQIGNFPFFFVQLANYMEPSNEPNESSWAGLREAQTMTLSVPNTGMATIIDIGEAKDIHPKDKDDVGYRLSLAARKVAYGQNIVHSGPTFASMALENNSIIITFDNVGSGLRCKDKYGYLKAFAIAGSDKKFVYAKAEIIDGNKVKVSAKSVTNPVAVRYAWADNPDDVNFYNVENLPAVPFRSDNW